MLDLSEVFRSQAKSGTSHFHAYATAYVNYRGRCIHPRPDHRRFAARRCRMSSSVCSGDLSQLWRPCAYVASGQGFLERGGDPLPASGSPSVPHAGGAARTQGRASAGPSGSHWVGVESFQYLGHPSPADAKMAGKCGPALGFADGSWHDRFRQVGKLAATTAFTASAANLSLACASVRVEGGVGSFGCGRALSSLSPPAIPF